MASNNNKSSSRSRKKTKKQRWILALKIAAVLFFLGVLGIVGFYIAILKGAFGEIPSRAELMNVQNPLASEVYSADEELMGKFFIENRSNVRYSDISPSVINALIATEDARFLKHKGVDTKSAFRVLIKSLLLRDRSSGGGSTISQQLAKNLYPRQRYSFVSLPVNKVKEIITAQRIEKVYSKRDILAMYLNTVSFGERAYGIGTASKRFFNKTPAKLTVPEAATLIGMLKAPTAYSPRRNPERSKARRNVVLELMNKHGHLSASDLLKYKATPLKIDYNRETFSGGMAPYFRDFLRNELKDWCKNHKKADGTPYNVYTDGLKIYTTLDYKMQQYAEEAVQEHMTQLQKDFDKHWSTQRPWGSDMTVLRRAQKSSERYKNMKDAGASEAEIGKAFSRPVDMTIFSHEGEKEVKISPLDSIIHYLYFLNAAFMVMDPMNGNVKAWVGGIDHKYFQYDHVNAKRQVGSTFKPIVYASALERGLKPCHYFPNELRTYVDYDDWTPENSDGVYGGSYSMQGAIMKSINTISVQILMQVGVDTIIDIARRMGIVNKIPKYPSIALGTADLSLFEMMSVYSTFPGNGASVKPHYLREIRDRNGRLLAKFKNEAQITEALSPKTAQLMTKMLEAVVDSGTGQRLNWRYGLGDMDIAGKTGTTQNHTNGWFMGFTPNLVAGAWVGGDDQRIRFRTIDLGQGANMALPIVGIFLKKVKADKDYFRLVNRTFPAESMDIALETTCSDFIDGYVFPPEIDAEVTDIDNPKQVKPRQNPGVFPPPTTDTRTKPFPNRPKVKPKNPTAGTQTKPPPTGSPVTKPVPSSSKSERRRVKVKPKTRNKKGIFGRLFKKE